MQAKRSARNAILVISCLIGLGAIGLGVTPPSLAASIPAWLDDAISDWNDENPAVKIRFVDIKDSYVWYMIPDTPEIGHKDIRESVYKIVIEHGYERTAEEELVTTGKPPSFQAAHIPKKCWTRSYVLNIEELSNTKSSQGRGGSERPGMRQRMLTSMVCEDGQYWFAGFRILQ